MVFALGERCHGIALDAVRELPVFVIAGLTRNPSPRR
jgi:hypothetical protein